YLRWPVLRRGRPRVLAGPVHGSRGRRYAGPEPHSSNPQDEEQQPGQPDQPQGGRDQSARCVGQPQADRLQAKAGSSTQRQATLQRRGQAHTRSFSRRPSPPRRPPASILAEGVRRLSSDVSGAPWWIPKPPNGFVMPSFTRSSPIGLRAAWLIPNRGTSTISRIWESTPSISLRCSNRPPTIAITRTITRRSTRCLAATRPSAGSS